MLVVIRVLAHFACSDGEPVLPSNSSCEINRGKKQMLCGDCNGAGFMGGFMNTQDD